MNKFYNVVNRNAHFALFCGIIVKYIVANEVIYFFWFVFVKEDVLLRQGLLQTYAPKIGTSVPKIISKGQKKKKGNIRETSDVSDGRRPLVKY